MSVIQRNKLFYLGNGSGIAARAYPITAIAVAFSRSSWGTGKSLVQGGGGGVVILEVDASILQQAEIRLSKLRQGIGDPPQARLVPSSIRLVLKA